MHVLRSQNTLHLVAIRCVIKIQYIMYPLTMGRMSNSIYVCPSNEVDAYPLEYSTRMDDALFKKVKHGDYLLNHHIREISVNHQPAKGCTCLSTFVVHALIDSSVMFVLHGHFEDAKKPESWPNDC